MSAIKTGTHEVNLSTALSLGHASGLSVPREVVIYAIDVADDASFRATLTPGMERVVGAAAAEVAREMLASTRRDQRAGAPAPAALGSTRT